MVKKIQASVGRGYLFLLPVLLYLCRICEPVCSRAHRNLKPGPFSGDTCFPYRHTGNAKNCPGKEQSKAGMLEKPALEYCLFMFCRYPSSIILVDNHQTIIQSFEGESDGRNIFPVAEGVFQKRIKNLFKQGIGVQLKLVEMHIKRDMRKRQAFCNRRDYLPDIKPLRGLHSDILVIFGEHNLGPDVAGSKGFLVKYVLQSRVGKFHLHDLEVSQYHGKLVEDIVPRDTVQQVEFVCCLAPGT